MSTTIEKTGQEQKLSKPCARQYCERETLKDTRAPVQVGDVKQEWCVDCIEAEFGLSYAEYRTKQESFLRYVTPKTVGAFCLGVVITMIVMLVFVP